MSKSKYLAIMAILALAVLVMVFPWPRSGDGKEILILCGSSMRMAVEEIKERYAKVSDQEILTTYGGSGELCAQIQQTQRGDIYVCHDPFMPWAQEQGLIDRWKTMASLEVGQMPVLHDNYF